MATKEFTQKNIPEEPEVFSFMYNNEFFILTTICSLPLVYFGGERLFGIATLCLLLVYVIHVSFQDTKSSVVGFVICVAVVEFCVLFSIGPLIWHSIFNIFLLIIYNVFILLTGGLGLLQFYDIRKDEKEFCANVEYFLFLLYPSCCVSILTWMTSFLFGSFIAPYVLVVVGFPAFYTFLNEKMKKSFSPNNDHVLGDAEKLLILLCYILSSSVVFCFVNFFDLLCLSSWISPLFFICVSLFFTTFFDTTDLRDMADIRNSQWQIFQICTGCLSLMLCALLSYIHGIVDKVNAIFLCIIFLSSTALFATIKYRYVKLSSSTCLFLLFLYILWFSQIPWYLHFSPANTVQLSFYFLEVLILLIAILSVAVVAASIGILYRSLLKPLLILHSLGFVVVENILFNSEVYPRYLVLFTTILALYTYQRLYNVHRLSKSCAVLCSTFHLYKTLNIFTMSNASFMDNGFTKLFVIIGQFCFSLILVIITYENREHLDIHWVFNYVGIVFFSLLPLSYTFLPLLHSNIFEGDPSFSDIAGLISILTGCCLAKLAFFNSINANLRKGSVILIFSGFFLRMLQPQPDFLQIFINYIPKLIFREIFYDTWQIVFSEYMILPWCMFFTILLLALLLFGLLHLKRLSSFNLNIISTFIGCTVGLCAARVILPYPKLPSSILSVPYMISTAITANHLIFSIKQPTTNCNSTK
ncbi:uncharacterized protein LOC124438661 isoform X2 [Xenia sp. Carnegie-2017]|nr:uncharacterized protein LOC124438661 isoform X2 [Xenia sp. Carnegie-2017]